MKLKMYGLVKACLATAIFFLPASAQSQQKLPRNYIGGLAILDATHFGIAGALEYERWLIVKNKWVFSAKADYVFPHRTWNLFWMSDDGVKTNNQFCLMASGTFFTGRKKDHEGFFLGVSAGMNYSEYQAEVYDNNGQPAIAKISITRPGHEIFLGGQVNFSRRNSFRLTGGVYQFYSKRTGVYPESLPLVLFFTKVSFGF